jgi:hypothetical protein
VVEQSWTEPLVALLLSALLLALCRAPRLAPLALGLLLASKQYLLLALPRFVWLGRFSFRRLLVAASVALVVSLPLGLWDPEAFFRWVVAMHWRQPLRLDALSYVAWLARDGSGPQSAWPGFVAFALAAALALWRCPRSPSGLPSGVALSYLAFFAFNKQAFCNDHFFVLGPLCCALAAAKHMDCQPEVRSV